MMTTRLMFVAAALLIGQAGATDTTNISIAMFGSDIALRSPYTRSTTIVYRPDGTRIAPGDSTGKYSLSADYHMTVLNVTHSDSGRYRWEEEYSDYYYNDYGYGDRRTVINRHDHYLFVLDFVTAMDATKDVIAWNRTLQCHTRFSVGTSDRLSSIRLRGSLDEQVLTPYRWQNLTAGQGAMDVTAIFNVTAVGGQRFKCELTTYQTTPPSEVFYEEIVIRTYDHLARLGDTVTFTGKFPVQQHPYLGVDVNDRQVIAGNRDRLTLPAYRAKYSGVNEGDLVNITVKNITLAEAGSYRWYIFGTSLAQRINVVVIDKPELKIQDDVVAGEVAQFECHVTYSNGTFGAGVPNPEVHAWLGDHRLLEVNFSTVATKNEMRIRAVYAVEVCADHHLSDFLCRASLVNNPNSVVETAEPVNVLFPPAWANIQPLARGGKYLTGTTVRCSADANPPVEYMWEDLNSNTTINGSSLHLDDSMAADTLHSWRCTASNAIRGQQKSIQGTIFFTVAPLQRLELRGDRLVRSDSFVTMTSQIHMIAGDMLGIERNDQTIAATNPAGEVMYALPGDESKYELTVDGDRAHLLMRDAQLSDSGSYRWSIFGTGAAARANIIVTDPPACTLPDILTAGETVQITCRMEFGIGCHLVVPRDDWPVLSGTIASQLLTAIDATWELTHRNTVIHTQVYNVTVGLHHDKQPFSCSASLASDLNQHVQTTTTLNVQAP